MGFFSRHKRIFIVGIIILCVLAMWFTAMSRLRPSFLENALGFVLAPAQKAATNASEWVSDKVLFFTRIGEIERENALLRAEVDMLRMESSKLALLETDNKRLSDILQISQKYAQYPQTGAQVIAKDSGNWFDRFYIDKGTKDGLAQNMVVLTAGGLVGKITQVGANFARVTSLVNDDSAVSAESARTEDRGIVRGDVDLMRSGYCRMDYLSLDAQVIPGDEIVTSNLGNTYPPGIIIGYVREVGTDDMGLNKYAIIEPVVNFENVRTVVVINKLFEGFDEEEDLRPPDPNAIAVDATDTGE
ncbi:MAG: rod shape-determining protein MreC [Clostridiales bacterium]|nr:rod shape-determining protein MreC [Clostridiales bacterium]